MKMPREFYFPKDATVYRFRDPVAMIAVYETPNGKPCAAMFGGKRSKPDQHFRFRNADERKRAVNEYIRNLKARDEAKAKRKEAQNKPHSLEVGDVLYSIWGYDQTNVDFYEVINVPSKNYVVIQKIKSAPAFGSKLGGPSERIMPAKGEYVGKPMRKKADSGNCVRIASYAIASKWEGGAKSQTGIGWGH